MELKDNERLIEVRTAYALNRIYNYVNRKHFKEHLILLQCLAESIDEKNKQPFEDLVRNSVEERILGATKKEIYASMKAFFNKPGAIASKLGMGRSTFYSVYSDLTSRDFINDKFINGLVPTLSKNDLEMCKLLNNFIDNFTYLTGDDYYEYYDNCRSLELEFLIIYNKIIEILQNPKAVENFLFKVCTSLDIDWSTISFLLRNITFIERNNTNQIMGKQQLRLEIFNLFYLKGFNKNEIGKTIFGKNGKIFYNKTYESSTRNITKDEWEFSLTFTPTLEWDMLNKNEVLKFISLFKGFVDEQL